MKSNIRILTILAAASAAACVSSMCFAQGPQRWADRPPQDHRADRMGDQMRAHAMALHDILNLRPDQEAAFQAFQASMMPREGLGGMREHHEEGGMARLTTPDRMDQMAARMAERQAEFQAHAEAVKRFYSVLNPEQRRAFDALFRLMGEGGHGMAHGPMGDSDDNGGDQD